MVAIRKRFWPIKGLLFLEGLVGLLAMTVVLTLCYPQFVFLQQQTVKAEADLLGYQLLKEETQRLLTGEARQGTQQHLGTSYTVVSLTDGVQIILRGITYDFQEI